MNRVIPIWVLLVTAFAPSKTLAASTEPQFIRLSWSQPDTAHTMTITWTTESDTAQSLVGYGIESESEHMEEGEKYQANGELGTVHVVELTGLLADTIYQYRVGGPGNWSDPHQFRTAPEDRCQPFRFAALGDNRPDTDWIPQVHWNPILTETVDQSPAFLIHTGDLVKTGSETQQWNTFFDTSQSLLATRPFMATIGNHDDGPVDGDGANYNQVFSFPRNSETSTEDFYYFVYGDAIFVSLSTQTFNDGDPPFQMQADWLDQVLTENPTTWKFVFLHHPPYTSHLKFDLGFTEVQFNHPPNEMLQNEALLPIFDRHHVDVVFAGHNHYYERFAPLREGESHEEGEIAQGYQDGTVYIITGGAGALTYDEFDILGIEIDLVDWVCGAAVGSTVCAGRHHYVLIDIDGPRMTLETWATAEQLEGYDTDNVERIDLITIEKDVTICSSEPEPEPEPELEPEPETDMSDDISPLDVVEEVQQPDGESLDPEPSDTSSIDDATTSGEPADEPTRPVQAPSEGCNCSTSGVPSASIGFWWMLLLGLAELRFRGGWHRSRCPRD